MAGSFQSLPQSDSSGSQGQWGKIEDLDDMDELEINGLEINGSESGRDDNVASDDDTVHRQNSGGGGSRSDVESGTRPPAASRRHLGQSIGFGSRAGQSILASMITDLPASVQGEEEGKDEFEYDVNAWSPPLQKRPKGLVGYLRSITFSQARPTIRAILMTAALLFSTSSTLGCRYLTVEIGFIPSNVNVTSPTVELGAWSYPPDAVGSQGGRCLKYPESFVEEFIDGDGSWKLSRTAGVASIVLGWAAFLISWLLVISRLKPTLPYKTALAFGNVFLFLFEAVKFIFLRTNFCTGEVWGREASTGVIVMEKADSCGVSRDGYMSIVAIVINTVLVIWLCRQRMREEMEARARSAGHSAGKRAARFRKSKNNSRRSSYVDYIFDSESDLDSLGFGAEEHEADKALSETLAFLESKRFDYLDTQAILEGVEEEKVGEDDDFHEVPINEGDRDRELRKSE